MDNNRKEIEAAINSGSKIREDVKKDWNDAGYTQSIVAFLDICGTKNLFLNNPNDFSAHKETYQKIDELLRSYKSKEKQIALEKIYGDFAIKHTVISDGIVLSIDAQIPQAFAKIFMIVGHFIRSFLQLEQPRFVRGAMTIGNLYHSDDIVFGSALVEAVVLESEVAENFEFIIKENHLKEMINGDNETDQNIVKGFFYQVKNGIHSFDYLYRFLIETENIVARGYSPSPYLSVLSDLSRYVRKESKNRSHCSKVRKKYIWMKEYLDTTLIKALKHSGCDDFLWLKDVYNNSGKSV